MSSRSLARLVGTALALAIPAAAEAAYTTASVNLRSGPGTDYGVVITLPISAYVDVHYCQPSWCNVSSNGYNGWIAAEYVGGARPYYPPTYGYQTYAPPPPPPVYIAPAPYVYPAPYAYSRPYFYGHPYRPGPRYYFGFGYGGW
jgi:Bacterial SH3 domain